MELKRLDFEGMKKGMDLLIVPYGIETQIQGLAIDNDMLLIVPYGIETWNRENAYNDPSAF